MKRFTQRRGDAKNAEIRKDKEMMKFYHEPHEPHEPV